MAITREVINLQTSNVEVSALYRPDFSDWNLVESTDNDGAREAIYQKMSGDPQYPATVRIGIYDNEAKQTTSISLKLSTFVKVTDDDGDVTYEPFTCTVAMTGPYKQVLGASHSTTAVDNLIAWGFKPVESTPAIGSFTSVDWSLYDRLKYGIPNFDLSGLADSPTV